MRGFHGPGDFFSIAVESDAAFHQVNDTGSPSIGQNRNRRRIAESVTRGERVPQMEFGGAAPERAMPVALRQRNCNATLRVAGIALFKCPFRHEQYGSMRGSEQCGVQPRNTASDHDKVIRGTQRPWKFHSYAPISSMRCNATPAQ